MNDADRSAAERGASAPERRANAAVTIVGIGEDGCAGLTSRAANAVARAQILAGGERQLAFFPQFSGERIVLGKGLMKAVDRIAELADESTICVLASGDPLFFGIGRLLLRRVGEEHVEILPTVSSMQWLHAKTGIAWDDTHLRSVHGRSGAGLVANLRRAQKAAILTDPEHSPAWIASRLLEHCSNDWVAWVGERLGGIEERLRRFELPELAAQIDVDPLSLVLLVRQAEDWRPPPTIPFLPEEQFAKRMPKLGLITKREVRALALALLGVAEDSVIWDIGAGSGSVAIEAAMIASRGRSYAIETNDESVDHCRDNALQHGADNVTTIHGTAPEALADLERPDCIFIGGSKGRLRPILDACIAALRPGGRLVLSAVTMESVAEARSTFEDYGLQAGITLLQVSRGQAIASSTRYAALNPIHLIAITQGADS